MPIAVEAAEAAKARQPIEVKDYTNTASDDDRYYATFYMGAPPDTAAGAMQGLSSDKSLPQVYLVEQPAGATVPPHFHDTDQFQVFVGGSANFGKKALRPVSIHYAGGHTPYGPIVTEEQGTHYFTLRVQWDGGGKPMPESRELLKRGQACYRLAEDIEQTEVALGERVDVLPMENDGLGAAVFAVPAGEFVTLDLPRPGAGQFAIITEGSVDFDGTDYGSRSCVYRAADEPAIEVKGGPNGARVLLLQFPQHDN